ncbi:unnamed protein product [Didymodactylos carnosus]|uniref:MULE transposase domain-containing protein n=1 Tax=Didymodactylos carnosus TaxID=1234261 RepID=A0A8S2FGP2_9BILA|nr:unnamed protein product [Didymodactylos carnosus]CAF4254760.1 unnamed protein product [Didymodactylos carnosus]
MYENGLTLVQIKKAVKVAYPQVTSDTQIQDVARWHRHKSRSSMKFIEDLQLCCAQRNLCPTSDKPHVVFVPYYEVIDIEHTFICLTTRQLLSTRQHSSVLAVDGTYKITSNNLPLLVFGTSDLNRHFFPIGICLISTDESADAFKILLHISSSELGVNGE